jgi:long-subunit fatty acid transport protein
MLKKVIYYCPLICLLLASGVVWADDGDVDIVGPTGRSSIAVTDVNYNYRNDQFLQGISQQQGDGHQSGNTLTISGIYAVNDRISVSAALPWNISDSFTFNWQGTSQTTNNTGVGDALGVSAILLNNTGQGFKLVGSIGTSRSPGFGAAYYAALQPQYRIDSDLLLTANFGVQHQTDYTGSYYANLNLLWRVTPSLSIVPSIGLVYTESADTYSSLYSRSVELAATYHINPQWAASASVTWTGQSTQTSDFYSNEITNGRDYKVAVGLRRWF